MKRIVVDMDGVPSDVYRRFPEYEFKCSSTALVNSRAKIKRMFLNNLSWYQLKSTFLKSARSYAFL